MQAFALFFFKDSQKKKAQKYYFFVPTTQEKIDLQERVPFGTIPIVIIFEMFAKILDEKQLFFDTFFC